MLGPPDDVRGCLFDLDGMLTQAARVHGAEHGADIAVTDLAELTEHR